MFFDLYNALYPGWVSNDQLKKAQKTSQGAASMGLVNLPTTTNLSTYMPTTSTNTSTTYAPVTTKKEMSTYNPTYTYAPVIITGSPNASATSRTQALTQPVQYDYIPLSLPTTQTTTQKPSAGGASTKQDMTGLLLLGGGVLVLGYFLTKESGKTIRATNPEAIAGKVLKSKKTPSKKRG